MALSAGSFACWALATTRIDPRRYDDLGLFSAAGPLFWLALAGAVAGFVCAVRALHFRWYVALLSLAVVVAVLYATTSMVDGAARSAVSLRELGIVDQLARIGHLERSSDPSSGWPGFFAMLAVLQGASGSADLLGLARWAPVLAAFAQLPPLLLFARALTPQPRVRWLTAGAFVMANWTGQDHVSPLTYAFWLLLCVAGVLMTVTRHRNGTDATGVSTGGDVAPRPDGVLHRTWMGQQGTRAQLSGAQWVWVHVVVVLGLVAVAASHQLTSVVLVVALFVLWVVGRSPHWWLWSGAAALVVLWLAGPAWPFVSGYVSDLATIGIQPETRPGVGSAQHLVVATRLVQSAVVVVLAAFGALLLVVERARIRAVVLLAAAPLLLVPLQVIDTGVLDRVFLFSLPLLAFLAAVFLFSVSSGKAWRAVVLASVLVLLAAMTVLAGHQDSPPQLTAESVVWRVR